MNFKPFSGRPAGLISMKFAIYLLIGIGFITALGTFIPQGQDPMFYITHYGQPLGQFLVVLSLHNLYSAWWFLGLIGILCGLVLICSYKRLRKASSIKSWGSLLFHVAIVVILIGAVWSLAYAHSATMEISPGETLSISQHGFTGGMLTLNSFTIDYYPDYQPRQYTSDLSLLGYEGRDYEQQIYVNSPLRAGNLKIYQSSWGWVLKFREISSAVPQSIQIKEHDAWSLDDQESYMIKAVFLPDYAEDSQGIFTQTPIVNNPHAALALYHAGKIIAMTVIAPGQEAQLGSYQFVFDGFDYYSGLQLKYDPGVNLVFIGFGLLLSGLLARYWQLFFSTQGD